LLDCRLEVCGGLAPPRKRLLQPRHRCKRVQRQAGRLMALRPELIAYI
jgi:hypothetical protein